MLILILSRIKIVNESLEDSRLLEHDEILAVVLDITLVSNLPELFLGHL